MTHLHYCDEGYNRTLTLSNIVYNLQMGHFVLKNCFNKSTIPKKRYKNQDHVYAKRPNLKFCDLRGGKDFFWRSMILKQHFTNFFLLILV